jgi:ABC-type branched-subunit amino acid transport system substrate-binding protein
VPHFESSLAAVKEYKKDLRSYSSTATPGFVSLEGYIAAKIFVEGVKKAGSNPTRENVIDGIESIKDLDIGIGTPITFSNTEHQASHKVWPTKIKSGKFATFNWSDLK